MVRPLSLFGSTWIATAFLAAATAAQAGTAPQPARFTVAQSLSDEAQRKTLAFAGLAMVTGNLEAQSFFPPGKVADYNTCATTTRTIWATIRAF